VRRFPAPWKIEPLDGGGFKIIDSQSLAYVYGHADRRDAETAKGLTTDEARRIASNIAKLPALLGNGTEGA
jgi:hypothetical protein